MTGVPTRQHHPFAVSLAVFEGPLDLLLHLVQQEKLAITAVSLVQVTGQYLAFMRATDRIDHSALADFVAIGARLIELKSRALLPTVPAPPPEPEEPEPNDLVEVLRHYQQFKTAAALLREREDAGLRAFPRLAPPPGVPDLPGLSHVTLGRLAALVERALAKREPTPEPEPVPRPKLTVRDKIAEIGFLMRLGEGLSFACIMEACRSREEVIVAFLAVLELMKAGMVDAAQQEAFGDIILSGRAPEPPIDGNAAASDWLLEGVGELVG